MYSTKFSAALSTLDASATDYAEFFHHGSLRVGLYRPNKTDEQSPHRQDEVYIVQTGRGDYFCDGERQGFAPGDVLFAPAQIEHRFENFSDDFCAWVLFYGPDGGEHE